MVNATDSRVTGMNVSGSTFRHTRVAHSGVVPSVACCIAW